MTTLIAEVNAGGVYRFVEAEDLAEIFTADEDDDDFNEDRHSDDDLQSGTVLRGPDGFVERTRYETIASITDSTDVDYYRLESPPPELAADVMTVTVRSLDSAGLIPALDIFDENDVRLPFSVLASGNGELIVQLADVASETNLNLAVTAASSAGPFASGNYALTVAFGSVAATLEEFASGELTSNEVLAAHTIFIAETTLFQFLVSATSNSQGGIMATLLAEDQTELYKVFVATGEGRSDRGVLLPPGTYSMQLASLPGGIPGIPVSYSVQGLKLNENFSIDPIDPTQELPFRCQEGDAFCYPGGNTSNDTYLWEQAVGVPGGVPIAPPTVPGVLAGDWWSWIWASTPLGSPPLTTPERFSMTPDVSLRVNSAEGVLSNDFDPDGVPVVALLIEPPAQGTLQLSLDGGFEFVPPPGFTGTQTFTYVAYDFQMLSSPVEVTIDVVLPGDFDASEAVNGDDFLVWQSHFGVAVGATPAQGDGDGDGDVDGEDFLIWQSAMIPAATGGSGASTAAEKSADASRIDFRQTASRSVASLHSRREGELRTRREIPRCRFRDRVRWLRKAAASRRAP